MCRTRELVRMLAVVACAVGTAGVPAAGSPPADKVEFLKSSYGEVPLRVAQEVAKSRIFGSAQALTFSNFESYKGYAYYSFTGTLPYVFESLHYRESVLAGALWETVGRGVAAAYWKLGGALKEVEGIKIQIRTSSTDRRMPLRPMDANEVITFVFTPAQLGRYMSGEIGDQDLFERSQVLYNGVPVKIGMVEDREQIASLAREIETYRMRTSR